MKNIKSYAAGLIRFSAEKENFAFILGWVLGASLLLVVAALGLASHGEPGLLWGMFCVLFQVGALATFLAIALFVGALTYRVVTANGEEARLTLFKENIINNAGADSEDSVAPYEKAE